MAKFLLIITWFCLVISTFGMGVHDAAHAIIGLEWSVKGEGREQEEQEGEENQTEERTLEDNEERDENKEEYFYLLSDLGIRDIKKTRIYQFREIAYTQKLKSSYVATNRCPKYILYTRLKVDC